jgi:GT2 family glycosyltransferase
MPSRMQPEVERTAEADEPARLPEPADPVLTVAVLSYNGRHLLEVILPSLAAQGFRDFRVVVVDNGSGDGTAEWLAEHWPQVTVVALPDNVGVTPALNVCVRAADTEFVGLFNNDLELEPTALGELVAALREHPTAASAGGKLVDFHDRTVLDGAGDTFAWAGTGDRRGHGERDRGQYDEARAFFGACGGAAVYRRAAFDVVGPFDEQFFAFFEDVDWSFRAQLAGFDCRYVPSAVVYHMGSATLGKGMSEFTQYHLWRNTVWLVAKDYPVAALVRHLPRIAYVQAAQLAGALHDRRLALSARAMRDALRGLPAALRRRRAVQRTRRRSVGELAAIVAASRDRV